jgi:aldose 1-epimerase
VAGTPFDFRTPARIGARIADGDEQLRIGHGYDHCFVLDPRADGRTRHAARVVEPTTGRTLDVHTTEPGVQLYTANSLRPTRGRDGRHYDRRGAFCLETQHFPDSPNEPRFPSTILRPDATYESRTVFRFGVVAQRG